MHAKFIILCIYLAVMAIFIGLYKAYQKQTGTTYKPWELIAFSTLWPVVVILSIIKKIKP